MKTRKLALLLALTTLPLAGCLTMTQELTVKSNGSAEAKVITSVDTEMVEQLSEMGGGGGGFEGPMSDLNTKESAEQFCKDNEMTLSSWKQEKKDGREITTVEVKAKDFKKIQFNNADDAPMETSKPIQFHASDKKGVGILKIGMKLPEEAAGQLDGLEQFGEEQAAMFVDMMQQFTDGAKMTFKVTLPGKILKTDLKKEGENTVIYVLDLSTWQTIGDLRKLFKLHEVQWDSSQITFKLDPAPKKVEKKPAEAKDDKKPGGEQKEKKKDGGEQKEKKKDGR